MEGEKIVKGWEEIEKLFPHAPGTIRKKYGKEMFEAGVIFKSHIGPGKTPLVWSFPSLIKIFISKKQAQEGKV
ncbi:MAG: hypothetical protein JXQ25_06045 [Deltaproteobacteria bacterium]|nr:hypothetical protein [Deltaproteobacteria bacterium]